MEYDPRGSDEAEPSPWDRMSWSLHPRVKGVRAHALGSDKAKTLSSESEPTPWGRTRQKPHPRSRTRRGLAPRVRRGRSCVLNHRMSRHDAH